MSVMLILRGIPCSGKSTFAKAWVAEDPDNRVRVNRDNLRWTLGIKEGVGTHAQETEVTYLQNVMIERAFKQGKDVVVDNTNLRAKNVKDLLKLAQKWGAGVEHRDFPVDWAEAVRRDAARMSADERFVGVDVIDNFYTKFLGKNGEFPPFPEAEPAVAFEPYVEKAGLPRAILVDIDGTLAHMDDRRGPYDTSRYHLDRFDEKVAQIARDWDSARSNDWGVSTGQAIIVLSGRSDEFEAETIAWLNKYDFWYDELYMRPAGDLRNDAIVKNELFEKHIAGNYNVDFVLDDRDRVVEMWRAKGLLCLQVAPGDF